MSMLQPSKKLDSYNEALYGDKIRKEMLDNEPKRTDRFIVEFPVLKSFVVQKIDKPKWINGKWSLIEMKLIDLTGPSTSQLAFGLTNPKDYLSFKVDKRTFIEKLLRKPIFTFYIKALNSTGVVVECWTISVKKISFIDFGEYDYESDAISMIHLTIHPKSCTLNY